MSQIMCGLSEKCIKLGILYFGGQPYEDTPWRLAEPIWGRGVAGSSPPGLNHSSIHCVRSWDSGQASWVQMLKSSLSY